MPDIPTKNTPKLILASASRYKATQLKQLNIPFSRINADIDESVLEGESAEMCALRLAKGKALAINSSQPAIVIACDQTAEVNNFILGKPGSKSKAIKQLCQCSGKTVTFHSAIAVLNTMNRELHTSVTATHVKFRSLSKREISSYIDKEPAFDCAGSFKMEGLGICLFESIHSDDPSALIGLPLIQTCNLLKKFNISPL
ncbi:MAG: septum formation protein [Flavobacteriales bacterium]|jgi:septum formation protein